MAKLAETSGGGSPGAAEKSRRGETAPSHGTRKEKAIRPVVDPEHNYGGRTERPDEDVNDKEQADDAGDVDRLTTHRGASAYSSPLPSHAFSGGDLYGDTPNARRAAASVGEVRSRRRSNIFARTLRLFSFARLSRT